MAIGSVDLSQYKDAIDGSVSQFDGASSEEQGKKNFITVSGSYVMEVDTLCFKNKKNELVVSPAIAPSSKGGLNLVVSLRVVDGTSVVPKGDYYTANIPIVPNPKASPEDKSKLFSLSKPRLCALLGVDDFKYNLDNIIEKFSTEWEETKGGKYILKKDHAMKSKVVCVFEDDVYMDRPTLKLVTLRRFREGDMSISNGCGSTQTQTGFGSSAAPSTVPTVDEAPTFSDPGAPVNEKPANTPDVVSQDELPF